MVDKNVRNCNIIYKGKIGVTLVKKVTNAPFLYRTAKNWPNKEKHLYLTKARKRYIITLLSSAGDCGREWGEYYFYFWKEKKKRKSKRSPFREEDRDELKKLFKKGLTKERKSDIIIKLPRKRAELITKKLFEKAWKKYLTKRKESDIILKLSRKRERHRKNFWKNLKKVLDKQFWMWYNIKAARKGNGNSILKIEQYKEKYNDPWNSFVIKMKESQEKDFKKHK